MSFRAPTNDIFTKYFHGWNRLEGRSRRDDFSLGLNAATADPSWMLAMQWATGELTGEDAGSPIHVKAKTETLPLDQIALGSGQPANIGAIPVEVLVEGERVDWDWRMRIRAGQHFERLARLNDPNAESTITLLRTTVCPVVKPAEDSNEWIEMDFATRRFVSMMAGHAIDGHALFTKIDINDPAIPANLQRVAKEWYSKLYSPAPKRMAAAWNSEKLDYSFSLQSSSAGLPGPLRASSYRSGSIDWDSFALAQSTTSHFLSETTRYLTLKHATYDGQPMRRWWEFEDHAVHFGSLDIAKSDLCKLILVQFGLATGDDHFVVPVGGVPPGSLIRVTSLEVQDCFQQVTPIPPARDISGDPLDRWEAFALGPERRDGQSADFLFVPPISGTREESPVIEEVKFARDEDANLYFAIEATVPNQIGEPVSGLAAHLELLRRLGVDQSSPATAAGTTAPSEASTGSGTATVEPLLTDEPVGEARPKVKYIFATKVPKNWIPFVSSDSRDKYGLPYKSVRLRRAEFVSTEPSNGLRRISPMSRLLQEGGNVPVEWINEEAVGREGLRVELRRQRMRSADGATYVWLGRKIGVGKGEARSGLRFDAIEDQPR